MYSFIVKGEANTKVTITRTLDNTVSFFENYGKAHNYFKQQVLNVLKDQQNGNAFDSSGNLSDQKKNTNKQERVYILGASQGDMNFSDSDISIDSTTARKTL